MMAAPSIVSLGPKLITAGEGRTPPHDLEAEAAVLSAILLDPQAVDLVADLLKPEHFYSEAHRRIYESVLEVHARGVDLDVVVVATELRDRDRLGQVGGMAYITEILNSAPAVGNVRAYASTVRDKWTARQVIFACQRGVAEGYTDYGESASEYVGRVAKAMYDIACSDTSSTTATLTDVLADNFRVIQAASASGRSISGLATGFDRYDRLTAGLHDGELTIVAARPGMGKTSWALNIVCNVASTPKVDSESEEVAAHPYAIVFFSLEMPRDQVGIRTLCSESRVDVSRVRTGMLSPTDWGKLAQGAKHLSELPVWIDDQAAASIVDVRAKARRIDAQARAKGRRLRLIVVDYVQLMSSPRSYGSREAEVSEISRGLKTLAKDMNLPVVALAQLNREVEKRSANKRPQLSDLRESGALEQDADNVCFIYRDEYYNKETQEPNIAELIVAKQRSGPTDTVRVRFDAHYTRFDNLADSEYEETDRHA